MNVINSHMKLLKNYYNPMTFNRTNSSQSSKANSMKASKDNAQFLLDFSYENENAESSNEDTCLFENVYGNNSTSSRPSHSNFEGTLYNSDPDSIDDYKIAIQNRVKTTS